MINVSNLKNDKGRVFSALHVTPERSVVALKKVTGYIPKRFEQSGLAEISESVVSILMVGIVFEDSYALLGGMTKVVLNPGEIREETINNDRYYVMDFEPGDTVIENLTVPQDSNMGYRYYVEFTKYARLPWYLNLENLLAIYDEAKFFTGRAFGNGHQAIRIYYALTMRDKDNLDIPYRYSPNFKDPNIGPRIIGINNPGQLLNSTFSRLSSGYMSDNIISGILNPDKKVTDLEEVIRGLPAIVGDVSNV